MKSIQGQQLPLGVTVQDEKIYFSVAVEKGKACSLLLYRTGEKKPYIKELMQKSDGSVYTKMITGIRPEDYTYEYLIDDKEILTDPYTKAFTKEEKSRILTEEYDWEGDSFLQYEASDVIAYSLHVRGFTQDSYSKVAHRGTFEGVIEKLPYLVDLGVNQIQCMPVYSFEKGKGKPNYWGYGPGYYFAPKNSYSACDDAVKSLKDMVKACHKAGIEVVLEMPFCETTPVYQALDCLRYYRRIYHVDGYILNPVAASTAAAYEDPYLSDCKLMVHRTDFQTVMRRFLKGDENMVEAVTYWLRHLPEKDRSFNYIAAHNGFTLMDLVSYDGKHNEANGEHNQDGPDYNYSWNCGAEGPSRKKAVVNLRKGQLRNALFLVFLSQGTPCLLAGDEFGNSQKGNNNVYCQDNPTGWVNWKKLSTHQELHDFVKDLITLRKRYKVFHPQKEMTGADIAKCGVPDVSYHGEYAWRIEKEIASRQLGVYYSGTHLETEDCYVAYNMHWIPHTFALPALPKNKKWHLLASTTKGICKETCCLEQQKSMEVRERTIVVLVAKKEQPISSDKKKRGFLLQVHKKECIINMNYVKEITKSKQNGWENQE